MSSNPRCRCRQSSKLGYETSGRSLPGLVSHSITSRCGSRYGRGASSTLLMTLKIAVLAPMPSARVITAMAVNAGCRRSERRAKRRSCFSTMRFSLRCSRPARWGAPFPRPRGSGTRRRGRRRCCSARIAGTSATSGHAPSGRLRGGGEKAGDGLHVALPRRRLGLQLLPAGGGEPVEAGALPLVGEPPFAVHQLALLEPVQGDVQGAVGDLERAGRRIADGAGDAVAVPRAPRERLENEDVERALEEVDRGGHGMSWSV